MFKSWRSYTEFERTVMRDRRYIHTAESEEFLDTVRATAAAREKQLKKSSIFWRAQLGYSWRASMPRAFRSRNTSDQDSTDSR